MGKNREKKNKKRDKYSEKKQVRDRVNLGVFSLRRRKKKDREERNKKKKIVL